MIRKESRKGGRTWVTGRKHVLKASQTYPRLFGQRVATLVHEYWEARRARELL